MNLAETALNIRCSILPTHVIRIDELIRAFWYITINLAETAINIGCSTLPIHVNSRHMNLRLLTAVSYTGEPQRWWSCGGLRPTGTSPAHRFCISRVSVTASQPHLLAHWCRPRHFGQRGRSVFFRERRPPWRKWSGRSCARKGSQRWQYGSFPVLLL